LGDGCEPIFHDDAERQQFVSTLGVLAGKTGWQVLALCLMLNHFHLVVETPQPTLVAGMKWFLGTHTGCFSRRHKLFRQMLAVEEGADIIVMIHPDYQYTAKLVRALVSLIRNGVYE